MMRLEKSPRATTPRVYVFETGHSRFEVDEKARQIHTILGVLARHVPGLRAA